MADKRPSPTKPLRDALKKIFFPLAQEKGFVLQKGNAYFYTFRKVTAEGAFVFDIQFEKYHRPRFVINLGSCGPEGVIWPDWRVAPDKLEPGSARNYARLQPGAGGTTRSWFCQDRGLLRSLLAGRRLDAPEDTVSQLVALFPEAEAYLFEGTQGPHIRLLAATAPKAASLQNM